MRSPNTPDRKQVCVLVDVPLSGTKALDVLPHELTSVFTPCSIETTGSPTKSGSGSILKQPVATTLSSAIVTLYRNAFAIIAVS